MASQKEITLCRQILELAIKVNAQGNYSVWADFSGHVNLLEVRVSENYDKGRADIAGWGCGDRGVYLSTGYELGWGEKLEDVIAYKLEKLDELKRDLSRFLARKGAKV